MIPFMDHCEWAFARFGVKASHWLSTLEYFEAWETRFHQLGNKAACVCVSVMVFVSIVCNFVSSFFFKKKGMRNHGHLDRKDFTSHPKRTKTYPCLPPAGRCLAPSIQQSSAATFPRLWSLQLKHQPRLSVRRRFLFNVDLVFHDCVQVFFKQSSIWFHLRGCSKLKVRV